MSRWRNSLGKVLHVGWRDFRYTALTPAFLIAVVGVPVLLGLAALVIYPILLSQETSTLEGRVVVIERGGGFAGILEDILERGIRNEAAEQVAEAFSRLPGSGLAGGPGLGFMNVPTDIELVRSGDPSFLEEAKQGVREERFLAVAMVPDALLRVPPADPPDDYLEPELGLYIPNDAPPQHVATLEQLLQEAVVESRAVNAGYSYDEIRRVIETPMMEVVRITETGEEGDLLELRIIIPIALMMLLWTIAFTSGNYVLTSTIEEKSNKVMEVLLSAVSPMQLMAGKILGQAAVASLMFVMYGGIAIIGLVTLAMTDLLSLQLLRDRLLHDRDPHGGGRQCGVRAPGRAVPDGPRGPRALPAPGALDPHQQQSVLGVRGGDRVHPPAGTVRDDPPGRRIPRAAPGVADPDQPGAGHGNRGGHALDECPDLPGRGPHAGQAALAGGAAALDSLPLGTNRHTG